MIYSLWHFIFEKKIQLKFCTFFMGKKKIGFLKIFMCIIQNTLWYYIREIINVNPLKPKIMKLAYRGKLMLYICVLFILDYQQFQMKQ